MFNVKEKITWLKCDEQCSKYKCANEHVGLAMCENKITACFDEYRN